MSQESHTVTFRLQSNLIVIDVAVDGESRPFIVDTGASHTVIDRHLIDRSAVEGASQAVGSGACGAGDRIEATMTRVNSLEVGGAAVSDLAVAGIDLSGINQKIGAEIAGIIGYDFLSRFSVTIDYRERTLTLTS